MNTEAGHFHKLYGAKKQRITYQKKDALDYALMIAITAAVVFFAYGRDHVMALVGLALCAFMVVAFALRHGVEWRVPIVLSRPQEVLYSLLYKLQNIKLPYLIAIGALLLENYVIYLTPNLPHHSESFRTVALYLFYGHFIVITLYRTTILIAHLYKRSLVREILMQSIWKSSLERQPSITLEIVHAYFTGMLTHIVLLAPWYLVITHADFSVVLLPLTLPAAAWIQTRFVKVINEWFYRDHWVGHNAEFDFVYLHGSHHDAIPSGLIGVAGNGYLEGLLRGSIAFPTPFLNPIVAALYYTLEVKGDIDLHQYIPGIFPKLSREFYQVGQHSIHHFGRVEPYSFALNLDQPNVSPAIQKQLAMFPIELKHSIKLDERLTGYQWDNPRYRWFMELVDKYQDAPAATKAVLKKDWVAEGFAAMRDCGDDISIVYGRKSAAAQVGPEWFELAHDRFDGIGGLAHLLREQGCGADKVPQLRGDGPTLSRAVKGLIAVSPALGIRQQQWRKFDATHKSSFQPVRERVAWQLLTERQTEEIVRAARDAGVTVNSYLLFHLDKAVSAQLTPPSANRLWMIPVNLRGAVTRPDHFLQMSFLAVELDGRREQSLSELHALVLDLKQRACHWGSWAALHLGKFIGAAGVRKELRKRDRMNHGWTGIFSNLGTWNVAGAGSWIFAPAISRVHPVGAGCVTMNGRMAITIQLHEAFEADLDTSYALLEGWMQGCLQQYARDESQRRPQTAAAVS